MKQLCWKVRISESRIKGKRAGVPGIVAKKIVSKLENKCYKKRYLVNKEVNKIISRDLMSSLNRKRTKSLLRYEKTR